MANRPMSKPITPLRGLTPTLFSCHPTAAWASPGSWPVCRATGRRPNGFPAPSRRGQRACGGGGVGGTVGLVGVVGVGECWGVGCGFVGTGSGVGVSGVVGVGSGSGSGVGSGVGESGVGESGVGVVGAGVAGRAGTGIGDDPGAGESVGGVDGIPIVPAGTPPLGAVGTPGVGMSLGPVVDRTGTVTTGCPVGSPLPARPSTPVGDPDEVGEPVSPRAGSAGPPARMVITVTASSPPPATPSACRALVIPLARFRAA